MGKHLFLAEAVAVAEVVSEGGELPPRHVSELEFDRHASLDEGLLAQLNYNSRRN